MAEEENGQEKTEDATLKRLEKAREDGQVARSRELGTTLLLMTGALSILIFGSSLADRLQAVMKANFSFDRHGAMDTSMMAAKLGHSLSSVFDLVGLILFLIMIAGVIGAISVGGWLVSAKPLQPKFNRLNPLEGLKRMFSMKALVELFKALAKFILVAGVATLILFQMESNLLAIGHEPLIPAVSHSTWIIIWSAIGMSAATLIIAAIDVPFQIYDNAQKLKMTKQQVKDEHKDSEGKPEVKSRIRQIQRELAQSRMMAAIPDADVVITNPEHFSVALKYDSDGAGAPVVVAKGADEIAIKIREIANAHDIPILRSPPLTRAVYFSTEIDQQIPAKLYLAVAQVLAYIYQLRARPSVARPGPKPVGPIRDSSLDSQLDIPNDLQFDAEGNLPE
ncbi:flagellar biosynthesis protein FlhB [Pseudomonadales bacterium]|nr:flagellar biosynthesis protein FlhB [Pseudomonadales bacterium]